MSFGKVALAVTGAVIVGIGLLLGPAFIGWRPRFGLEADFQQVIRDAAVSDYYGNPGWDREDVTEEVCPRVNVAVLKGLGMNDKPIWPMPFDGEPARPTYRWRMVQDAGLVDICRTRSNRYIEINIDAETLVCAAEVSVLPQCDM
ncbi:hypothetical protein [Devosia sp.]|uniref:hypothetical protein n=1 Tax=Devosia sp. TaxID=1871048 RepID=UPI0019F9BB85|nr:hypothetical protein [Devosia sp.]MBE0580276.1 hypothetical protein [Devosia sp.]